MFLQMKDIHAGYDKLNILKGINLEVKPKQIVALIGPNGAGKSTVLKSIFSLAQVTKGNIFFQGKKITHLKTHELIETGISFVSQGKIVFQTLTVQENLEMGAELIKDKDLIKRNLVSVYKRFPVLKTKRKQLAYSLSGGQRQALALGRALMYTPTLLLLDEPSLGLSPKLQKELFLTIKKLKEDGIAILVVEQNAKKAIEIADKTYLLEQGKIVLEGKKEILKHKKIKNVYLGGRY